MPQPYCDCNDKPIEVEKEADAFQSPIPFYVTIKIVGPIESLVASPGGYTLTIPNHELRMLDVQET